MGNEIEAAAASGAKGPREPRAYLHFPSLQNLGPNGGVELVLTGAAYRLHLYALMDSQATATPGFISDRYLAERDEETAATVASLCAAGLWERANAGYFIIDRDALEAMDETAAWADRVSEACLTGNGHVPDAANPVLCAQCHGPILALGGGEAAVALQPEPRAEG